MGNFSIYIYTLGISANTRRSLLISLSLSLSDNIEGPDKANFLKEIEMMKKVSGANHDHRKFVVNMLACVTIQEPMMLVLEYATHGDLLTYLRNSREGVRSCQLSLISLSLGALVSV